MPDNFKLTIGNRIRISRHQLGLSQHEFGSKVQVTNKTISGYEVGGAFPSLGVLRAIAELTNKPLAYFIDERETTDHQVQMRLKRIEDDFKVIRKLLDREATQAEEKKLLQ